MISATRKGRILDLNQNDIFFYIPIIARKKEVFDATQTNKIFYKSY